jgi:hypothetical protein
MKLFTLLSLLSVLSSASATIRGSRDNQANVEKLQEHHQGGNQILGGMIGWPEERPNTAPVASPTGELPMHGRRSKGQAKKSGKKSGKYYNYRKQPHESEESSEECCECTCGDSGPDLSVELKFRQDLPNSTVPVAPGASRTELGTVYLFSSVLYEYVSNETTTNGTDIGTILSGTFVTGVCTRTLNEIDNGGGIFTPGSSYCLFTYTIMDDDSQDFVTFNAAGEVVDVFGGTLSITGGTGALVGAYGDVELLPVYETFPPDAGDFFSEPLYYLGEAVLFIDHQIRDGT